jgi:hypothetical protein
MRLEKILRKGEQHLQLPRQLVHDFLFIHCKTRPNNSEARTQQVCGFCGTKDGQFKTSGPKECHIKSMPSTKDKQDPCLDKQPLSRVVDSNLFHSWSADLAVCDLRREREGHNDSKT